ncbi:MAG: NUDIX hydrolase [Oscillospiraceae bacterium]|nr:NUDIX hydrolase [Oscillospiraceae bacterium]
MDHLHEKQLASELIYDGKILKLTRDTALLENGETAYREVVHHSGGVCVLPLDDEGNVLFVKQFRYPFASVLLEIPAGKREKGEDPLECGIRELSEEVGATAKEIIPLGKLYPTVAYDTEVIYMFLARGLSFGTQHLDDDEFVDVTKIPLKEAYDMVMRDEIPDSKTQIAILKAWAIVNETR